MSAATPAASAPPARPHVLHGTDPRALPGRVTAVLHAHPWQARPVLASLPRVLLPRVLLPRD